MISDNFVLETPESRNRRAISDRDTSQGRLSAGSFTSPSLNENFGDWGFNSKDKAFLMGDEDIEEPDCNIEPSSPEYPFSVQNKDENAGEEDGFKVTDRKCVPKLPVSQREIRKVSLHGNQQPLIIFDTDADNDGENDFLVSRMDFKSPVSTSRSLRKHRTQPTRHVKRSVSDIGSFGLTRFSKKNAEKVNTDTTNVRDLWSAQKGCELSLSFSERRRPSNGLLEQIERRRQSCRNLILLEEDENEEENDVEIEFSEAMDHPVDDEIEIDIMMGDDEIFEGTIPLKTSPTVNTRKRSTSKNRMKRKGSVTTKEESPIFDEFGHRRPTRKGSYGSRSSTSNGTSSTGRRSKTRKNSLSGSSRKSESTDATTPTNGVRKFSSDLERQSLLKAVRERRAKNQRIIAEKDSRDKIIRRSSRKNLNSSTNRKRGETKKTSEREKHGNASEEVMKNTSKSSRRPIGRRASISMTGNIVESQSNNRRRESMDHHSPAKPRSRRRATMDYIPTTSPSSNHSPSDHLRKARYKSRSKRDLSDPADDDHSHPIPNRVPFGEEGTETTQEESDSYHHQQAPPSRKSSIASRDREPFRRNQSAGDKSKMTTDRRKFGRNRSDLGRQKHRSNNTKKEGKSVSVEEIMALVATTRNPEIPRRGTSSRVKRWRSCDQLKGANGAECSDNSGDKTSSTHGSSKTNKDSRDRNRERSSTSSPREKSRSRSRRGTLKVRKGKRVDSQPEKETSSPELGKGSRRHLKSRRASEK